MGDNWIVAGRTPWSRDAFERRLADNTGLWHFVSSEEALSREVQRLTPDGVFFLHWSRIVPTSILESVPCVNFHMTDLPYGRGGSPLQNLLVRGHRTTTLSALRMTEELDAGPVLLKRELDLGGTAEDIYIRAAELACDMIVTIVEENPPAVPQSGPVTVFKRRKPQESCLPETADLRRIHDHIRMLDAEGYPRAFVEVGGLRLEFRRASLYRGRVVADVEITVASETS